MTAGKTTVEKPGLDFAEKLAGAALTGSSETAAEEIVGTVAEFSGLPFAKTIAKPLAKRLMANSSQAQLRAEYAKIANEEERLSFSRRVAALVLTELSSSMEAVEETRELQFAAIKYLHEVLSQLDELRKLPGPVQPGVHAKPSKLPAGTRSVILLVNIGNQDHNWLTQKTARQLVDDPTAECLELHEVVDLKRMEARQWRSIAHKLDELVQRAREKSGATIHYVIAGRAPLPVFAYLGQRMRRMEGSITFVNQRQSTEFWDWVDSPSPNDNSRGRFTVSQPSLGRERSGRVVLSLRTSREYHFQEAQVESLITDEGGRFLASYEIADEVHSHFKHPLDDVDLQEIIRHVEDAIGFFAEECPDASGLVLALACPSWVAFWVANRLNPRVVGRLDLPDFIRGRGYVRALTSPMYEAPWIIGKPRVLVFAAEPQNETRTRASAHVAEVHAAIERELGRRGPVEIRVVGSVQARELMREVELFKPDIIHMSLHGSKDGELAFEDERGDCHRVAGDAFLQMLHATGARPTMVVLCACHLAQLAPELLKIAECVVGMSDEVPYKSVNAFAADFYGALARGATLKKAFDQGTAGARVAYPRGFEHTVLRCQPGVDPDKVRIFPKKTDL